MKFLVDNNLSPKVAEVLTEFFQSSEHVMALEMDTASDKAIWEHAKDHGFTILSKDNDFEAKSRLFGCPPKVVQLTCGNVKTGQILSILRKHITELEDFLADSEHCLLIIS